MEQSAAKQNQLKEMAYEALVMTKQRLVEAYVSIYGEESAGNTEPDKVLLQTQSSMADCQKRFELPPALCRACDQVYAVRIPASRLECLSLLTDVVKVVEDLEKWMEQQIIECNICNSAFFKMKHTDAHFARLRTGNVCSLPFCRSCSPRRERL